MIKKRIIALAMTISTIGTMVVTPLYVSAQTYYANVSTFTTYWDGLYMTHRAKKGWTETCPTATGVSYGYDTSYKEAEYREYDYINGNYTIHYQTGVIGGTAYTVSTKSVHSYVSGATAKRVHISRMHKTSSSSSNVVESNSTVVIKP